MECGGGGVGVKKGPRAGAAERRREVRKGQGRGGGKGGGGRRPSVQRPLQRLQGLHLSLLLSVPLAPGSLGIRSKAAGGGAGSPGEGRF